MLNMLKSRTIMFSIALAVASASSSYVGVMFHSPVQQGIAGIALAAIIALLRAITTQPLADK